MKFRYLALGLSLAETVDDSDPPFRGVYVLEYGGLSPEVEDGATSAL